MRRMLLALLLPLGTVVAPGAIPADATIRPQNVGHGLLNGAQWRAHELAVQAQTALAAIAASHHETVAALRSQWSHVAWCEVHGDWDMVGPNYSGIGFANTTWYGEGGQRFAPRAGEATMDEQILIGERVTGGWVPDQYGCDPGGW